MAWSGSFLSLVLTGFGLVALPLCAGLVIASLQVDRLADQSRLQERQVRAVGATHRDLEAEVREGRFRADLYYRLNVVTLEIPPLARRREDIAPLAAWRLRRLAEGGRKRVEGFAPEAMSLLVSAPWPGNVRQLFNVVEQAYTLVAAPIVPETLVRVLEIAAGNVTQAAELAGHNRTDFYKLLRRHRIDPAAFKVDA